jgi:hypothetical protein
VLSSLSPYLGGFIVDPPDHITMRRQTSGS